MGLTEVSHFRTALRAPVSAPRAPTFSSHPEPRLLTEEEKLGLEQRHDEAPSVQLPDPKKEVTERPVLLHQEAQCCKSRT